MWSPQLTELRNELVQLYPTARDAMRIASDSGLNLAHIDFSGKSINIWHGVLSQADLRGKIRALLEVALAEYPDNTKLQQLTAGHPIIAGYPIIIENPDATRIDWPNKISDDDFTQEEGKLDLSNGLLLTSGIRPWEGNDFTKLDLSNNELQKLPREVSELPYLKSINLSGNKLHELPAFLFYNRGLTELIITNNSFSSLPEDIGKLVALQRLFLGGNKLESLPDSLGQLQVLQELEVNDNLFEAVPEVICRLLQLQNLHLRGNKLTNANAVVSLSSIRLLDLDSNQLTGLPVELNRLLNLSVLRLRGNRLSQLDKEFSKLHNLTILDLRRNLFKRFPASIVRLPELTSLLLSDNEISSLPSDFSRLRKMQRLELANNQIRSLPSGITNLTELMQLDLTGNHLTALPEDVERWSNLEELLVSNNRINSLPLGLAKLNRLRRLDLRGNPLPLPEEVLSQIDDPAAIIASYFNYQTGETRPLNEAKMLIVGQGSVGKTSLVKRLTKDTFSKFEGKTAGIEVTPWTVDIKDQPIRVNIWDFGGQEIMHATHQFFLTRRSLYLLVLNLREDERANRVEYWLKIIKSFGDNAPIIIVGNKVEENPLDINMSGLQAKYPNIRGFIPVSCWTGQGIDDLKRSISQEIGLLEHVQSKILVNWFAVKKALESMHGVDYLPYDAYLKLCDKNKVEESINQRALLELLHQLGVVLCYQDDPRLQDTNILNPEWVTNGVYTILNSNLLFQQRGVLERSQLNEILDPVRYPPTKHSFLLDLMRKFELCFDLEGYVDQKFLVPDLLYWEELDTGDWSDALRFRYDYDVLPGSIMTRFIVKMHSYIHQQTYWRTGVVLAHEDNRALIKGDIEDRRIYIWVAGPTYGQRNFLSNIRFQFDSIHKTIPGIKAAEKVPLPARPGIVVDYQHLLTLERLNEETFIPEGMVDRVSVRTLLDGVVPEEERRRQNVNISFSDREAQTLSIKEATATPARDPWRAGSFYLMVFVVVVVTLVGAANYTQWYTLPIILIAALIVVPLVGVLQALNDGTLSEKGFLKVVIESFERLPLLKGRSNQSSGDK